MPTSLNDEMDFYCTWLIESIRIGGEREQSGGKSGSNLGGHVRVACLFTDWPTNLFSFLLPPPPSHSAPLGSPPPNPNHGRRIKRL